MGFVKRLANTARPDSFSNRRRARRFESFERLIVDLPRPLTILDVGGTQRYWKLRGFTERDDIHIVIANIQKPHRRPKNVSPVLASATHLPFADGSFEVAFSNSVIEHLETFDAQSRMAVEVRRVAKRFYVQTPNRYFPMEPHFYFLFFQFLPLLVRARLVRTFNLGKRGRIEDPQRALDEVKAIRLMTSTEVRRLFPDASLLRERFFGLTKSVTAVRDQAPDEAATRSER